MSQQRAVAVAFILLLTACGRVPLGSVPTPSSAASPTVGISPVSQESPTDAGSPSSTPTASPRTLPKTTPSSTRPSPSSSPTYAPLVASQDRKSTRLNSSHGSISYA